MESSTGKTFGRKTYETPLNLGQKTKENYESWENLFRKTMSKEPLFSFTRTTENPIHWIHLLDPFDQHDVSKGLRTDTGQKTTSSLENASSSGINSETIKVNGKGGKGSTKGSPAFGGEKIPLLKLPEAVVALAQVAAKATGGSLFGGSTDLSGWPLIPAAKVPMMKCEKCSMEFCSPLNYKRHVRMVHRRPSNAEKDDFSAQRQQLAVFWDNLAPEAARDIVRQNNLVLEDLNGESLVKALTSLLQQPSLFSLPLPYAKAGASLLELVQNKSTRSLPASSDLLNVLDDSSEKTFPSFACGSMHRYVFDNEARKVGLEIKNLVGALGFLVERNLVKAWINNKDAEALRCQIALVEEEEASQRKRAEIQEKKRLKKARQKESRDKERKPGTSLQQAVDTMDDGSPFSSEEGDEYLVEKQSEHPATLATQTDTKFDASYLDNHSRPSSTTSENMFLKLAEDASDTDDRLAISDNAANSEVDDSRDFQGNESQHREDFPISSDEAFLPLNSGSAEGSQLESDQKATCSGSSKACFREGYASDRKFRHTWRERKWSGTNGFRSFQKQVEWGSYSPTSEGTVNPSTRYGKSFQEIPVSLASRSEYSADRSYVSKRQYYNNAGSGHAVWARKVQSGTTAINDVLDLQTSLDSVSSEDFTTSSKISEVVGHSMPVATIGTNCAVSQSCSSLISLESSSTSDGGDLDSIIVSSDVAQNHGLAESCEVDKEMKGGTVHIEPESDAACDTLVIGSLSVPLGVSFVEPLVGLPEITVATSDKRRRTELEETQKSGVEALGALHENSVSQCGSCKDVAKDNKSLKSWLYVDPECKENHGNNAIVHERPSKIARPSGYGKYGRLKVWRPICAASLGASTREPLTAETPGSNDYTKDGKSNDSSGDAHSKTCDTDGGFLSGKLDSCDIEVSQDVEACDQMLAMSVAEQDNKLTQGDAVENTLVDECDHQSKLWSTDFIAHFLSERWADAVNSTDSDIHHEEKELLNERVEDMGNLAVESRIIHKHWYSGTGIRATYGKNGKVALNGSRYNFSRPGLSVPVRFKPRESLHWTSKAGNGGYKYVPK